MIMALASKQILTPTMTYITLVVVCPSDCTPSFEQSSICTTTEACQGFNLLLECTTERSMSTVFQGNLFNCSSSVRTEITLLHSRFNAYAGNNTICNGGKVLGYSLPVNNSSKCYTSQLCIMVTPDVIGKSIRCAYDNGMAIKEIGSFSIEKHSVIQQLPQ